MNEHSLPDEPDDAAEAELIRKVLRTQERHREGGVDPELDQAAEPGHAAEPEQAADAEP